MRRRASGIGVLLVAGCLCVGGVSSAAESRGSTPAQRAKKDRGDISMQLGGVAWSGTSASVRVRSGTLKLTGSRSDGDLRNRVRQSIELLLPGFDGPGVYTAALGSMFLVTGIESAGESESQMDAALVEALTRASHTQLEGAEVVIESASETELVGRFSFDRGEVQVTDGRFRALVKE